MEMNNYKKEQKILLTKGTKAISDKNWFICVLEGISLFDIKL